jgi:hypothetical protein
MKTTLITENIDGHEIVRGLGKAVVDPIQAKALIARETPGTAEYQAYQTKRKDHAILIAGLAEQVHRKRLSMQSEEIVAAIKASAEYQHYEQVKATADSTTDAGVKALSDAWTAYKLKEKAIIGQNANVNAALLETQEYQDWVAARDTGNAEIKAAHEALLVKRRAIVEEADIFCVPKAGEKIITDEESALIRSRLDALPEKSRLTTAGETIEDRRGEKFWHRDEYTQEWLEAEIAVLGEELPATGVFHKDLTPAQLTEIAEQRETMRIDGMTQEERQAEFDQTLLAAQREAVFIRSEKELTGMDPAQALTEAQDWLADRETELRDKYGIA